MRGAALCGTVCFLTLASGLLAPASALAQAELPGVFPDGHFQISYQKYAETPEAYTPFYSWDGTMALEATAFRKGVNATEITAVVQTAGTENLHSKVSVGGTAYLLGFDYKRTIHALQLSGGYQHLSSHLTRDLDAKEDEVRKAGGTVPTVADPPEYNVIYVRAAGALSRVVFAPRVSVTAAPIAFRFNASPTGNVRRVFVQSEWTLLKGTQTALVAETQHELGTNLLETYALRVDLLRRSDTEGRVQLRIQAAPGHELHVSPFTGATLDGIALGIRLNFRSGGM